MEVGPEKLMKGMGLILLLAQVCNFQVFVSSRCMIRGMRAEGPVGVWWVRVHFLLDFCSFFKNPFNRKNYFKNHVIGKY